MKETLKLTIKPNQNMIYEIAFEVDSERVGTYPCDKDDDNLKKLLPLVKKYKEGTLSPEDKDTIQEVFDEISAEDEEFYDADTIREVYVNEELYDEDDIKIVEQDLVANAVDSDYCIVSYFTWDDQILSAEIDADDFDMDKLTIECVKTLFTEGHSFQAIKYEDDYLEYDSDATDSGIYHLKIYKKRGSRYVKLVDFHFANIFEITEL